MNDQKKELFAAADYDGCVLSAFNDLNKSLATLIASCVLHPKSGVSFGRLPTSPSITVPHTLCIGHMDVNRLMELNGNEPVKVSHDGKRYYLHANEIKAMEEISGKNFADLIAQKWPNRPARDGAKPTAAAPAPAG